MRGLYFSLVYAIFFVLGVEAPFILTLGYVWVDTFRPHLVAYTALQNIPVSMVMGVAALGSYFLLDRRHPPRLNAGIVFTVLLAIWVTLTTTWAASPDDAWPKWDWAFKTVAFSAFVPFVIRSRNQIEAFLAVYVFAFAAHILPYGIKAVLGGTGYGRTLGLIQSNSGIAESSTLAAIAASTIPLLLFLKNHGSFIPKNRFTALVYWGLCGACVAATVGTYARTGVIGLAVVGIAIWLKSKHKVALALAGMLALGVGLQLTSDTWMDRMSTIKNYNSENSALGRIRVWEWTIDYVKEHPLGGGFNVYVVNSITLPTQDGSDLEVKGKAFHSIYFEVLGEHGFVGLFLFLGIAALSFRYLWKAARAGREYQELQWTAALASALMVSLVALMACGAFIGIAFQPPLYYIFSASFCIHAYVQRVRAAGATAPTQAKAFRGYQAPQPAFGANFAPRKPYAGRS
jgi:putative inorganic carbon (hco3(-)) transporter